MRMVKVRTGEERRWRNGRGKVWKCLPEVRNVKKFTRKAGNRMRQRWQPTGKDTTQGPWVYLGKYMSEMYCFVCGALGCNISRGRKLGWAGDITQFMVWTTWRREALVTHLPDESSINHTRLTFFSPFIIHVQLHLKLRQGIDPICHVEIDDDSLFPMYDLLGIFSFSRNSFEKSAKAAPSRGV